MIGWCVALDDETKGIPLKAAVVVVEDMFV